MKTEHLLEYMRSSGACGDAVWYVENSKQSLSKLYDRTSKGGWLVWLARETNFPFTKKAQKRLNTLAKKVFTGDEWFCEDPRWDDLGQLISSDVNYNLGNKEAAKIFRKHVSKKKFFEHLQYQLI